MRGNMLTFGNPEDKTRSGAAREERVTVVKT